MIVEKPDSQKLARAYREYKDALKHWEDIKAEVAKQYTSDNGKVIVGWDKIQFSADFRAIVPDTSQFAWRGGSGWAGNCLTNVTSMIPASSVNVSGSDLVYDSSIVSDLTVKEKQRK